MLLYSGQASIAETKLGLLGIYSAVRFNYLV